MVASILIPDRILRMNWEPDWEQVFSERWQPTARQWAIPAGGYLLAIHIQESTLPIPRDGDLHYKAQFEITDVDHTPLYGSFNWHYELNGCGIAFKEPLPNFNSRGGYIIHRIRPRDDFIPLDVTITHLAQRYP